MQFATQMQKFIARTNKINKIKRLKIDLDENGEIIDGLVDW